MDEANFTNSNKNKPILVDTNGYQYKKKRDSYECKYWTCRKSGCYVKAVSIHPPNATPTIKSITGVHNHSSQKLKKRVSDMENEAVINAARNPTLSCRMVLSELSNRLNNDGMAAASTMSNLSTLKTRVYRARYLYNYYCIFHKLFKTVACLLEC